MHNSGLTGFNPDRPSPRPLLEIDNTTLDFNANMINDNDVPVRFDHLITEEVDGELMIYDQNASRATMLNSSSALVWSCCDGVNSVEKIIATIVDALEDVDEQIVENDIKNALAEFSKTDLISWLNQA